MIKLTSEEIKKAVIKALLEMSPDVAVYKEAKTNPTYPHFFVNQISVNDYEQRKNIHLLSYNMTIRYRVASDPSTNLRLEQDLDSMALKLLNNFNLISYSDGFIRISDKSIEKVDGVLHFFFTITIIVKNISDEQVIKQNKMEVFVDGD